jgi:hypothetical protein
MNQDPVEQYPDYYASSAYRSTHIPIMPPSSDSEHGPKFIGNHMTYGRFPWSLGSEQFFPVGGVQGQFLRLKFEHDKGHRIFIIRSGSCSLIPTGWPVLSVSSILFH